MPSLRWWGSAWPVARPSQWFLLSMVHTRAQRRVEAAAEHNMMGGSATLPDELLLRALELVIMRRDGRKDGEALCGG